MSNKAKVFVTNIVSDKKIELVKDIHAHKVICDCTVEGSTFTERGTCRIFSYQEYDDVVTHGFYMVEKESAKKGDLS